MQFGHSKNTQKFTTLSENSVAYYAIRQSLISRYTMRLRFVLLWLSFISTAVLATEADMTERQIPVPIAVSDELKHAITQFGIPTVQQALDSTPTDKETWLALIHSVNTEQKKKVKKMRKQYNVNVEMMNINELISREDVHENTKVYARHLL